MSDFRLWDDIDGMWRRTPNPVRINGSLIDAQTYATQGRWDELEAWRIFEEWRSSEPAPLGWNPPVVEMREGRNRAVLYPAGTESERAERQREIYGNDINGQRVSYAPVDLSSDPGLEGIMLESISAAEAKLEELDATDDADIYDFDPALDVVNDPDSQQIARALIIQESPYLNDPALTTQQQTELQSVMVAQQAVVDSGDPDATVPEPPTFMRTRIGVVAEDFGSLIARRVNEAGWWWLTFELRTERELNVNEYWISVYNETASDDRDDTTTGYLTVAQLTQTQAGVYVADRAAVNLPSASTTDIYKFTLNWQHLSNPQFDKLTLPSGVERRRYRARWAGRAG